MPLGNLTSQFFANVYLNELDYYVKHKLKAKYYIRYVDDFVILHQSKKQLESWLSMIEEFLTATLHIKLHPDKSHISPLVRGIDFVGFRNFYHHCLLRKRNIRSMYRKVELYKQGAWNFTDLFESYRGWQAYAKWADAHKVSEKVKLNIVSILLDKI
jgi:RNA-directed DNA polymerase